MNQNFNIFNSTESDLNWILLYTYSWKMDENEVSIYNLRNGWGCCKITNHTYLHQDFKKSNNIWNPNSPLPIITRSSLMWFTKHKYQKCRSMVLLQEWLHVFRTKLINLRNTWSWSSITRSQNMFSPSLGVPWKCDHFQLQEDVLTRVLTFNTSHRITKDNTSLSALVKLSFVNLIETIVFSYDKPSNKLVRLKEITYANFLKMADDAKLCCTDTHFWSYTESHTFWTRHSADTCLICLGYLYGISIQVSTEKMWNLYKTWQTNIFWPYS